MTEYTPQKRQIDFGEPQPRHPRAWVREIRPIWGVTFHNREFDYLSRGPDSGWYRDLALEADWEIDEAKEYVRKALLDDNTLNIEVHVESLPLSKPDRNIDIEPSLTIERRVKMPPRRLDNAFLPDLASRARRLQRL